MKTTLRLTVIAALALCAVSVQAFNFNPVASLKQKLNPKTAWKPADSYVFKTGIFAEKKTTAEDVNYSGSAPTYATVSQGVIVRAVGPGADCVNNAMTRNNSLTYQQAVSMCENYGKMDQTLAAMKKSNIPVDVSQPDQFMKSCIATDQYRIRGVQVRRESTVDYCNSLLARERTNAAAPNGGTGLTLAQERALGVAVDAAASKIKSDTDQYSMFVEKYSVYLALVDNPSTINDESTMAKLAGMRVEMQSIVDGKIRAPKGYADGNRGVQQAGGQLGGVAQALSSVAQSADTAAAVVQGGGMGGAIGASSTGRIELRPSAEPTN